MEEKLKNKERDVYIEIETPETQKEQQQAAPQATEPDQASEWQEKYLRLAADFENYKKRTAAESLELRKRIESEIFRQVLKLYDDFVRLEQNAQPDQLAQGIRAIRENWQKWMRENQIEILNPIGEAFDPHLHEAVMQQPVAEPAQDGRVTDVLELGYRRGDEVLRHAKVAVGRYQGPTETENVMKGEDGHDLG